MDKYLSTKIRACATISSLSIIYIHNSFIDEARVIADPHDLPFNFIIQTFIAEGVARWGLVFFWIMSGFLFFRTFELTGTNYFRKIRNRFISLFIPYVIWSGLGIVYYFIVQTFIFPEYDFTREKMVELTYMELAYVWLFNPTNYQLWFLRDLFLLVLISPLLYLLLKYFREGFVAILLFLYLANIEVFWPVQKMLSVLGFSMGGLLALNQYRHPASLNRLFPVMVLVWLLLISIHTWSIYRSWDQPIMSVFFKISRLMGVYILWKGYDRLEISQLLERKDGLNGLIYVSFFLYLFHEPFLTSVRQFLFFLIPITEVSGLLLFILIPLGVFFVAYILRKGLRQYFPGMYGVLTGNR